MSDKKIRKSSYKKTKHVTPIYNHKQPILKLDEGCDMLMKELINALPNVDKSIFQNCFNKVYNTLSDTKYGNNVYELVVVNNVEYYVNNIGNIFDKELNLSGFCYKNGKGCTEYNIFSDLLNDDEMFQNVLK